MTTRCGLSDLNGTNAPHSTQIPVAVAGTPIALPAREQLLAQPRKGGQLVRREKGGQGFAVLGVADFTPDYVDATAHVTVTPHDGGFKTTKSPHRLRGEGEGHRSSSLRKARRDSQGELPGILALAGTEITLERVGR